jgi:hypothetical protein
MKYAAITSMNKTYFEHCGEAMLESYRQRWSSIPLYLYNEDFEYKSKNVVNVGWNLGIEYENFQSRWSSERKVTTFAKKGFSIIHAMHNVECDRLIWLDADTVCARPIHGQLLDLISPDNVLSTHFGVVHNHEGKDYFSCETGFFILNKRHPKFKQFRAKYTEIYTKDRTENLRRFYDGEVYGETVRQIDADYLELNPGQRHKTPIPRSVVAPYIEHYKAGVKDNITNQMLKDKHSIQDEI